MITWDRLRFSAAAAATTTCAAVVSAADNELISLHAGPSVCRLSSLSACIRADVRAACAANATITSCQFQSRDKPAGLHLWLHCTRLTHVRPAVASESYSVLILKTAV